MKKIRTSSQQVHASRIRRENIERSVEYDNRWRKFSVEFRRQNPFCASCLKNGSWNSINTQVDHIIPLEVAPERKYDSSNLQVLCRPSGR